MNSTNWYFEVNNYCQLLSEVYQVPLIKVAGIMSALSPNNTFDNNINSLEKFLSSNGNCKVSTFNGQKIKAQKIFNSNDNITLEEIKYILSPVATMGLKTKAFFDNIFRPEISEAVTVDLWMIRWAKLEGCLTPKRYRLISEQIKIQATNEGLKPHQLQAKLWVEIRKSQY